MELLFGKYPASRRTSVVLVKGDHRYRELEWTQEIGRVSCCIFTEEISSFKLLRKPGQEFRLLNYQISVFFCYYYTGPVPISVDIK